MFSEPKKLRPQGLRSSLRLSGFFALLLIVGFLGLFGAADYIIRDSIVDNEREIIVERLTEYRAWFLNGQIDELEKRFKEQSDRSDELYFVRIAGRGVNAFLFSSPEDSKLIDETPLQELADTRKPVVITLRAGEPKNIWTVASSPVGRGYLMQTGRISTKAFEPANRFRRVFLWAIIPASILALFVGILISYQAMKPVRDLTATAAEIVETGDLEQRVSIPNQHSDLAEMGILFNRMLDRNESLIQSMKQSLDNVAHDLRTPMARMRATAESALTEADEVAETREALADCVEESDHVLTMLNTLMDIAEAETGVMHLHPIELNVAKLIHQVAELYELIAEEHEITIEVDTPDVLLAHADETRMQQVIANLVDNAIKYSSAGGTVWIKAANVDSRVQITISDRGIGIHPDDLPRIWDRLYRADASRSKRGLGLGLSFVKAIVDAHGGDIGVTSAPGNGSSFQIRI